jgi:hypothetical protein
MDWLNLESTSVGSFRLCRAIHIPSYGRDIDQYRCDSNGWGPVAINWSEDSDMFGTESLSGINNLHDYKIVIDCAPYFYITYNKFTDIKDGSTEESLTLPETAWNEHPETVAPTLAHLLRLMIEWDSVFHDPFYSQEFVSELSHKALSILGMTPTVCGYLVKNYPPMPVERFLLNDVDAKSLPVEGNCTKGIENYLIKILEKFQPRSPIEESWESLVELPENGHESFL